MKYCVISSNSSGNCTYVESKNTKILIDFGCTQLKVKNALSKITSSPDLKSIDYLLITHSHSDHIKNIKAIDKSKYLVSFDVLPDIKLNDDQYFVFYEPKKVGDFIVTPLPLSHDAKNTTGFLIEDENSSLVYITDTGYIRQEVLKLIKGKNYYIFESNHDTKMLYTSKRDAYLISRIHSDKGHLDNISSASYLADCVTTDTKEIVLAHLSEECNTPNFALEAYKKVFEDKLGEFPSYINLRCADIDELTLGGDFLTLNLKKAGE